MWRLSLCLSLMWALGQSGTVAAPASATSVRAQIDAAPKLRLKATPLIARAPHPGWASKTVSGVAVDSHGLFYQIQRGTHADPILVLNRDGAVLRSWGKGDFELPHSITLDAQGHVWAVDAGASKVIEYTTAGKKLQTISIGEVPDNGSPFHGATDVAPAPNGHLFITDGYGNARILEYTADGKRLRQWGHLGSGPGELHLPHAIQLDEHGNLYVADRENGRIEEFDPSGKYLGQIGNLGRVFALRLAGPVLWATVQLPEQTPGSGGWLVKLDRSTGHMLGWLELPQGGGHGLALTPTGDPVLTAGTHLVLCEHPASP